MGIKLEEKVEQAIADIVNGLGFEIEYVEFAKEGNDTFLRVVIDKLGGTVTIDDCEAVSRAIENVVEPLISMEYILEVASPGLERELKNMKLYQKYINQEIYVKLYKKGEYGKEITGILVKVDTDLQHIELQLDETKITIPIKDIATAHTTFDFDAVLKEDKKINLNQLGKF